MLQSRSVPFALSLVFSLLLATGPASAQSVASVVDDMKTAHQQQLETVNTYIVETNLYTAYNQKVMRNGAPTYQTQTQLKGQDASSFAANTTPSAAYGMQFDQLKQHAIYAGPESIGGTRCHVLRVDDPSAVDPNMGDNAGRLTYYVDAERHVPVRMVMQNTASG